MPLEANDYEKINGLVQSLSDKLSDKMDRLVDSLVRKSEYEARHGLLIERVMKVEAALDRFVAAAQIEHDKINSGVEAKFKDVSVKLDAIDTKFDELNNQKRSSQETTIRYIISVIVSFLIGNGLVYYLLTHH